MFLIVKAIRKRGFGDPSVYCHAISAQNNTTKRYERLLKVRYSMCLIYVSWALQNTVFSPRDESVTKNKIKITSLYICVKKINELSDKIIKENKL